MQQLLNNNLNNGISKVLGRTSLSLVHLLNNCRFKSDALIIGAYQSSNKKEGNGFKLNLTETLNNNCNDELTRILKASKFNGKKFEMRSIYGLSDKNVPDIIQVVGLGEQNKITSDVERQAVAIGSNAIRQLTNEPLEISVGPFNNMKAVSEGLYLRSYSYKNRFNKKSEKDKCQFDLLKEKELESNIKKEWDTGKIYADAQNLARYLSELPANYLTPTIFANKVKDILSNEKNVEVLIRNKKWIKEQNMGAFLSVAKGSTEEPKFLEIYYRGKKDTMGDIGFIGKGVTFDSGGISLKPARDMKLMKGDLQGGSCLVGMIRAVSRMELPVNIGVFIPLSENMPSGSATKPGDVVYACNNKSIEVDNTDAEGRLLLADALHYSGTQMLLPIKRGNSGALVTVATLTGAIGVALGSVYSGVFTNDTSLWKKLKNAGKAAGDPFWRMPLSDDYKKQILTNTADLKNSGGRDGGACTAAVFVKQFVPQTGKRQKPYRFAHIDIGGVDNASQEEILGKGMTGRPTRSLIEFVRSFI